MIKMLFSMALVAILSIGCAEQTNNTEGSETPVASPTTETPTAPLTEELGEEQPSEEVATTPSEEPTTTSDPASTSEEEPIKDQARPRDEASRSEPSPEPSPATEPTPKNNPPVTNKSNNNTETGKTIGTKPGIPAYSHEKLDILLRKHVSSSGKVNYRAFKKDHAVLEDYINLLELNPPKSDWSKNKQMAYWINLYNAFTIHTILENYPVNSIMDIEGGKVWDKKTINIGGETLTLNKIEKEKLLQAFKEPRVHFAVNCAAASCPPLLNKAWTEDNVQRYLQQQAKAFINNSQYNQLAPKSIQVSQIFNWYADDFGGKANLVSYLQKYADTEIKDKAKVSFNEYDWNLNN